MRSTNAFILLVLLGVLSCRPPEDPEPKQYSVPTDIEKYVQTFRVLAQQRGQTVATDNLIITFGPTKNPDACGQCLRAAGRTPRITIKADELCWKRANEQEREALILHELGHCWLNRDHRNDRFPIGAYASLMNADDASVYSVCRYPISDDVCNKFPRRPYYHDELFDPATPTPAWAR
jgi:hypothetical protein